MNRNLAVLVVGGLLAGLLGPDRLEAQDSALSGPGPAFHVAFRAGALATPTWVPACGYSYVSGGLQLRSAGRWFVALDGEVIASLGGDLVLCAPVLMDTDPEMLVSSEGGVELDQDAFRIHAMLGRRVLAAPVSLELAAGAGTVSAPSVAGRWHPWVGGAAAVGLFGGRLTFSYEHGAVRYPVQHRVYDPDVPGRLPLDVIEERHWGGLSVFRAGVRIR